MQKSLFISLTLVFLGFLLSSCYLPQEFHLDVRITKNGDYALRYEGDLIAVALRKKLMEQSLSDDELSKELEIYNRDLSRDPAFSLIEYKGDGVFNVKYVYVSNVEHQANYNFLRGNNRILRITYDKKKATITVKGRDFSEKNQFTNLIDNYKPSGNIRVISDLELVHHNAGKMEDTQTPSYLWQFNPENNQAPFIIFAFPVQ